MGFELIDAENGDAREGSTMPIGVINGARREAHRNVERARKTLKVANDNILTKLAA